MHPAIINRCWWLTLAAADSHGHRLAGRPIRVSRMKLQLTSEAKQRRCKTSSAITETTIGSQLLRCRFGQRTELGWGNRLVLPVRAVIGWCGDFHSTKGRQCTIDINRGATGLEWIGPRYDTWFQLFMGPFDTDKTFSSELNGYYVSHIVDIIVL